MSVCYDKLILVLHNTIERFADSQNVKDYIVQGRLMKEKLIPWKARPRYEWA